MDSEPDGDTQSSPNRPEGDSSPPPVQLDRTSNIILDSVADGVFTVDRDWRITSFNRAAVEITGVSREAAIGRRCCEVFRASICESDCALREALQSGRQVLNKAVFIVDPEGHRIPISVSAAQLVDPSGQVIGGVETFRDLSVVEELRRELESRFTFRDIVSKSRAMRRIFDLLPSLADSEAPILIEGESGTGKELVARAIHDLSPRADSPMVAVNCGALPDSLLESELFGYRAGAFTDARKDKPGRFARADGGTLLLDEIGDISAAMQVRLLRVLQDGVYEPLGATEPQTADVRIVGASNKSLEELVAGGRFREDLYYRLNVVRLELPPLRERPDDIPLLLDHFIRRLNRKKGRTIEGYAPEVLEVLMRYEFPGNIRELENAVEHAFVLCRSHIIELECLPDRLLARARPASELPADKDDFERQMILRALSEHDWSRVRTADRLGIHTTTLWRKMKKLGIVERSEQ